MTGCPPTIPKHSQPRKAIVKSNHERKLTLLDHLFQSKWNSKRQKRNTGKVEKCHLVEKETGESREKGRCCFRRDEGKSVLRAFLVLPSLWINSNTHVRVGSKANSLMAVETNYQPFVYLRRLRRWDEMRWDELAKEKEKNDSYGGLGGATTGALRLFKASAATLLHYLLTRARKMVPWLGAHYLWLFFLFFTPSFHHAIHYLFSGNVNSDILKSSLF